jgi:predicted amidophosphoribosyltransferase
VVGMRGWWQDLTDLVLPAECGGCGRPRTVLCPGCRAALSGAVPRRVRPVPEPPGLPVVHAAARYADEVRAALLAHKERGALALAAPLGVALAGAVGAGVREAWARADEHRRAGVRDGGGLIDGGERGRSREADAGADGGAWADGRMRDGGGAWAGVGEGRVRDGGGAPCGTAVGSWAGSVRGDGAVVLVPVPSARRAVRARGHDPARRIALAAARELRRIGTPARVAAVLRQRRDVADQAGLNSRQRLENLAGALAAVPGGGRLLVGGPVVLVDDLMTTGASLAEAARAVRAALTEETAAEGGDAVAYRDRARERVTDAYGASVTGRDVGAYGRAEGVGESVLYGGSLRGWETGSDSVTVSGRYVCGCGRSVEIGRASCRERV